LGSCATAHLGAVFIECHVANPVKAVFNAPVAAAGIEQLWRVGVFGLETGDSVDGFGGEFVAGEVRGFTADRTDLLGIRKIQVSLQFGAGPDVADLEPSMSFINGGVLRGEKTPI
jgi:hypothetical protein